MRHEHLEQDDDSAEREVQRDDDRHLGGAETEGTAVPRTLRRERDEADAEKRASSMSGRFLDEARPLRAGAR